LDGATVSRATLHNFDIVRQLDVRKGDVVKLKRAGMVIPEIIGVAAEKRTGKEEQIEPPTTCPSVEAHRMDGAYLKCVNITCPAQLKDTCFTGLPVMPWTSMDWRKHY